VPAVLFALVRGPWTVVFVAVVYLAIEAIDDYIILPLLNDGAIWLPPAPGILRQVLFGSLWGVTGLLFAIPVVTVLMILVQVLYVEGALGEDVRIIGEANGHDGRVAGDCADKESPYPR
jgi:predicted PurR-regulated permease PerM